MSEIIDLPAELPVDLFEQVADIYPNGLPFAHTFLATRSIQGLQLDYQMIRKITDYKITNRGAWLRFMKRVGESTNPGRRDDNVTESYVEWVGMEDGTMYYPKEGEDYVPPNGGQVYYVNQFGRPVFRTRAIFNYDFITDDNKFQIWEHTVLVNGEARTDIVDHEFYHPGYPEGKDPFANYDISDQLSMYGHCYALNVRGLEYGKPYLIQARINGVASDPMYSMTIIVRDPATSFFDPVIDAAPDKQIWNREFDVQVTLPRGTKKTHDWTLIPENLPAGASLDIVRDTAYDEYMEGKVDPTLGLESISFRVYPRNIPTGKFTIKAHGTAGPLFLESQPHEITIIDQPNPNEIQKWVDPRVWAINSFKGYGINYENVFIISATAEPDLGRPNPGYSPNFEPLPIFPLTRLNYPNSQAVPARTVDDPRGAEFKFTSNDTMMLKVASTTLAPPNSAVTSSQPVHTVIQPMVGSSQFTEANDWTVELSIDVEDVSPEMPANLRAPKKTFPILVTPFFVLPFISINYASKVKNLKLTKISAWEWEVRMPALDTGNLKLDLEFQSVGAGIPSPGSGLPQKMRFTPDFTDLGASAPILKDPTFVGQASTLEWVSATNLADGIFDINWTASKVDKSWPAKDIGFQRAGTLKLTVIKE